MALALFDTWTRETRPFESLEPGKVGMYGCGPTVYHYAHIGNLRTYLFEDILRRTLEARGYTVEHVMNITDVGHLTSDADTGEDKMEVGSRRTGMTAWDLAAYYQDAFMADLEALNVRMPTIICKATDHIPEQLDFISDLADKGYTYRTSDGIYFDSTRLNDYGHLARLDTEGLRAGARVDQGERRAVTDFALWKFSAPGEQRQMEWDSPWGRGFPGWHIECSAMSARYLGDFFDIHCGGEDHIPIHHTNEIAQTEASRGTRLANFWMHGYFLQQDSAKMAKSTGDFLRIATLEEAGFDPLVYRYFCMTGHYRTQMSFSWESLDAARTAFQRLREMVFAWGEPTAASPAFMATFDGHLDNDLNAPRGLAAIWDLTRSDLADGIKKASVLAADEILGLGLADWVPPVVDIPAEVTGWAEARHVARGEKNWAEADRLREKISAAGYTVEDTPDGPRLKPV